MKVNAENAALLSSRLATDCRIVKLQTLIDSFPAPNDTNVHYSQF